MAKTSHAGLSPPSPGQAHGPLNGKLGIPIRSAVLFLFILLPYRGLSLLLTLLRLEAVRPFEKGHPILACWGPNSCLPQLWGSVCLEPSRRPSPEQSSTLNPMHPFGTSATFACLPVLGFISFLFLFHCDTATGFNWLLVFYYSTFSMCVYACVFVCVFMFTRN